MINIRPHKVPALAEQRKLLEHPQMRRALALHDVSEIFRLVQRFGVSQRRIAAKTGQSQSEISEILAGKRQVHAYYVLDRIATGFGVPRGYMGLAYDQSTIDLMDGHIPQDEPAPQDAPLPWYAILETRN